MWVLQDGLRTNVFAIHPLVNQLVVRLKVLDQLRRFMIVIILFIIQLIYILLLVTLILLK